MSKISWASKTNKFLNHKGYNLEISSQLMNFERTLYWRQLVKLTWDSRKWYTLPLSDKKATAQISQYVGLIPHHMF